MLCGCGGGAKQTSKDKQGLGALCCAVRVLGLSQSKGLVLGLVLCAGAKQTKQGFGLSYNQKFGALVGAVRVYLTSKLWLGAWLGAKRKDKVQG
jgi:uncharacterized membrane protein YedE/YeeE